MTNPARESAARPGSRGLQLLGLAIALAGVGIIFAGEFDVLPRSSLTSGIGGGVAALGLWLYVRGRLPKS